ncbi:MAG: hypothetical protein KGL39_22555 [Patescibacteria group bacterium]|nr:hypothetical protein [Patescibacteria group bacterium]
MHIITDSQGQTWELSISVGSIRRVRALTRAAGEEIDLLRPELGEPPLAERLTDPCFVCDLAWCLVKPQADALAITDEQFGERMAGTAIGQAMTALYEELIDFFRSTGRQHLAEMLTQHRQIVQTIVDQIARQVKDKVQTTLSTSSPESSESIPPTSPCDGSTTWCGGDASTPGTAPAYSPASSPAARPEPAASSPPTSTLS